jgi:hypothetical protein
MPWFSKVQNIKLQNWVGNVEYAINHQIWKIHHFPYLGYLDGL